MGEEVIKVYLMDGTWKSVKVNPQTTTVEDLWEIVGDKLGFDLETGLAFFIWGVQDDLELLLYANSTIEEVRTKWPSYMEKWSNNQQQMNKMTLTKTLTRRKPPPQKEFQFWFRTTCINPLSYERKIRHPEAVNLFFAECVHNVVNSHYPCSIQTAVELAAFQAQAILGDHNPELHRPGYLGRDIFHYIPRHLRGCKKVEEWEAIIYSQHAKLEGKDGLISRLLYLQLARQWPYYGCTFFTAKYTPPSQGFYRQDFSGDVVIGLNGNGLHLIDPVAMKVISIPHEHILDPRSNAKMLAFAMRMGPKHPPKQFFFKTNQGELIDDLIHDWFAEYRKQHMMLEAERKRQASTMNLNGYS